MTESRYNLRNRNKGKKPIEDAETKDSDSDQESSASEYEDESDDVSSCDPQPGNMSVDEEQASDDDDDDDINYEFAANKDDPVLPKSIVYLKPDANLSFRCDPRLFDVLNDRINDNNCDDINRYLQKYNDERINKEYFHSNKHGGIENIQNIQSLYLRKKAMNCVMNKIEKNIEHIIENADRNIFDDIVKFAQNTYSLNNNKTSMEYLWALNECVIPTAMLMCGQNISDLELHFEHLQNQFETSVSPLIVRFKQTDLKKDGTFGGKMYNVEKFIIDTIFQKLTDWKVSKSNTNNTNKSDNVEYYDMKQVLKLPPINRVKNEIIRTFLLWYFRFGRNVNKYWRKNNFIKSCFDELPKIILMIDGIEQWSPIILSSLIYILHDMTDNYKNITANFKGNIPFILVLGVSTTEDLMQQMIEADALRLLSVNRYYFEPSHKLYSKLAEEILIESSPILFDECILNKLLHHCELNDFSVNRFKDQIKYLFMSFFMNTKASQYAAYLMYLKDKDKDKQNRYDDDEEFDLWWFSGEEDYISDFVPNTQKFKHYITEIFTIYTRYVDALRVFKMICDHLDFKWSRSEIIAKLQDKQLLYKYLLARVGAVDDNIKIPEEKKEREQFPQRIEDFKDCHEIYNILEQKTKSFDQEIAANAAKQYKIITSGLGEKPVINTNNNNNTKTKRKLNAKQKRLELKRQLTANTNKVLYGEGRKNLFQLLRCFIEKHLKPMKELPLNEIFVYSKESKFCRDMFPPTNSAFRKRYENYAQYLADNNSDNIEPEGMCCLYDVYQEIDGLYINLHDAYIAFKQRFAAYNQMQDEDDDQDKKRRKKKRNNKNINVKVSEKEKRNQIQFRMSVDDLRFCGFVKATNRKKEALMKMADLL